MFILKKTRGNRVEHCRLASEMHILFQEKITENKKRMKMRC